MKFQLEVQDSKVNFFLELIKGFQFIKAKPVEEAGIKLSKELKNALDEAIESENYSTHSEVMERSKERYPNLFK